MKRERQRKTEQRNKIEIKKKGNERKTTRISFVTQKIQHYHQCHVAWFRILDMKDSRAQLQEFPSQLFHGDAKRLQTATPKLHLNGAARLSASRKPLTVGRRWIDINAPPTLSPSIHSFSLLLQILSNTIAQTPKKKKKKFASSLSLPLWNDDVDRCRCRDSQRSYPLTIRQQTTIMVILTFVIVKTIYEHISLEWFGELFVVSFDYYYR